MSNDNVINLFGGENHQAEGQVEKQEATAEYVLDRVKEAGDFEKVIIIGLDTNNFLGFATNIETTPEVIFIIEKLKMAILDGDID